MYLKKTLECLLIPLPLGGEGRVRVLKLRFNTGRFAHCRSLRSMHHRLQKRKLYARKVAYEGAAGC